MSRNVRAFDGEWLEKRLARLLPGFPEVSICVAFSGGLDSTALLAALAVRRRAYARLRAIHINHDLQPHARRWATQCKALATSFDVPLKVIRAKVNRTRGTSLEAEARKARYEIFTRELTSGEVLLTAHHEDDQLETVLLQLFRGAGLAGLAAMPDLTRFGRGWLARPLLPLPRASLELWARARRLVWIEDEMNDDERFDRVYLRRQLLPLIKSRWPGAGRAASRSARHAAEAQRLLSAVALSDVERAADGEALSAKSLRRLSLDRRRNALRYWITRAGAPAPNTSRLDELAGPFLHARPESTPEVTWGSVSVTRCDDLVSITSIKDHDDPASDAGHRTRKRI